MAQQNPSSKLFVFRPSEGKAADVIGSLGEIERLDSEGLVLIEPKGLQGDPEEAWKELRKKLSDLGELQPVLIDESGESHYPTGDVTVRFHESPSDEELEKFAGEHGLRLRKRNEFISKQAVFEVEEQNDRYLPNVVTEISGQKQVKNAWANTLSRYKRSTRK